MICLVSPGSDELKITVNDPTFARYESKGTKELKIREQSGKEPKVAQCSREAKSRNRHSKETHSNPLLLLWSLLSFLPISSHD
jgi:hypothetical protein